MAARGIFPRIRTESTEDLKIFWKGDSLSTFNRPWRSSRSMEYDWQVEFSSFYDKKRLPPEELILQFFSMHVHHDVIVLAGFTIELLRCSPSQYAIVASHGLGLGFRTKKPSWWILLPGGDAPQAIHSFFQKMTQNSWMPIYSDPQQPICADLHPQWLVASISSPVVRGLFFLDGFHILETNESRGQLQGALQNFP